MQQPQYTRWQYATLIQALQTRRVLLLTGPRQCGKTTLAEQLVTDKVIYRTLDNLTLLEAARIDPHGFVSHDNELMIIDEVQRAPELLQAIKMDVDAHKQAGRFLLTGSTNIQSLPGVNESLAGRIRTMRLRPLAQGEIHHKQPTILQNLFAHALKLNLATSHPHNKNDYLKIALAGGYPEALTFDSPKETQRWYQDYIDALISRDLKDIINLERHDAMRELLFILAAWSSKFIDISAIASSVALSRPTINSYINALEAMYLVERVKAWSKTDYDRVNKKDKLFMTDTGLMAAILNWKFDDIQFDGDRNGKLLETFIFNQLSALIDAQNDDYRLYHYRDRQKREIDFIVENEQGNLLGIEVRAGSSINKTHFKHLSWFKENLAKDKLFTGIILYTGNDIVPFGERTFAIPINKLWHD